MNIGDKVRMLRGREEGVIVGFAKGNIVEVEIEDGFAIPVLRSELVVVSPEEARLRKNSIPENNQTPTPRSGREAIAERGIFLAFVPINDVLLVLHIVNNTDFDLPYTLGNEHEGRHQALRGGLLERRSSVKVSDYNTQNFEKWGVFVLQVLFFRENAAVLRPPVTYRTRFRANVFFKAKAKAPLLDKEAHLFQLDKETEQPVDIQPQKIMDSWEGNAENSISRKAQTSTVAKPAAEVDLHIEKLTTDLIGLANAEMLQIQLQAFEKNLDNAIAFGMPEITFIHGLGSGTLRTELHRRLGKHPHVGYFEDAQKEKFGYGATRVKLK